jgi:hypothetical protein
MSNIKTPEKDYWRAYLLLTMVSSESNGIPDEKHAQTYRVTRKLPGRISITGRWPCSNRIHWSWQQSLGMDRNLLSPCPHACPNHDTFGLGSFAERLGGSVLPWTQKTESSSICAIASHTTTEHTQGASIQVMGTSGSPPNHSGPRRRRRGME